MDADAQTRIQFTMHQVKCWDPISNSWKKTTHAIFHWISLLGSLGHTYNFTQGNWS